MKASPVDPDRIYASQTSGWFGQIIQRSDDGGKTWNTPGSSREELKGPDGSPKAESNKFVYDASPETGKPLKTHQWYDGTQHPWEFKRVWHLEPSLHDPNHVYAGVEDAALFESKDGGKSWHELAGLRGSDTGPKWQPGAGGMCLHTILLPVIRIEFQSRYPLPAHFAQTTAAKLGNQLITACIHNFFRTQQRKLAIACTGSRSIRRAQTRCSCKNIGT